MGSWDVLDNIALADCAFEIHGCDLDDLFATAARALADLMVDPETVARDIDRTVRLEAPALDLLLHDWMSELIFLKDSEQLIFPDIFVSAAAGPPRLTARLVGGRLDRSRAVLRADPKAVTFHQFALERRGAGWYARVVIDI